MLLRWRTEPGWPIDSAVPSLAAFGFPPEVPADGNLSYAKLIHPDDLPRVQAELGELVRSAGGQAIQELRLVCHGGESRWVEQRVGLRRDATGRATHFEGLLLPMAGRRAASLRGARERLEARVRERSAEPTLADRELENQVADRRAGEQRLRESESEFRRMVETTNEGIWVLGPDERTTFVNARTAEMLGYGAAEILGRPLTDFQFDEDAPDHRRRMEARSRGLSEHYERRFRRKDGQTIWVLASATPILDEERRFAGSFAMLTDITDRKRAEDALEEERRLFIGGRSVAFNWRAAEGWPVEYVSPNITAEFGYAPEQFTSGQVLYGSLVHPEDLPRVTEEVRAHSEKGIPCFEQEYRLARADGEYRWVYDFTVIVRAASGTITHYHGYVSDITERKRDVEALRRSNRELRALSLCNQALIRATDERTLLGDICRIVCDEAGYRMAWVGYVEHDEAKAIRPVAWAGFDSGYLAQAHISWAEDSEAGRGPGGIAARSGQPLSVQDIATEPRMAAWREQALLRGYRSCIALPLKDEGAAVFGILLVYSSEPDAITAEEMRLMEELAGDLAFGIVSLRTRAERKRAERGLALMSFALNNVHEAAFLIEEDARFFNVNEEACRILGYTREELLAKTVSDVDPDFPLGRWFDHWRELKSEGSLTFEGRHRAKDGRFIPVEVSANYFEYGGQGYNLALVRDIAERKRAERERERLLEDVQKERSRLQVVLDTVPVGIGLCMLPDARLRLSNKAAEALFERPAGAPELSLSERARHLDIRLPSGEPAALEELPLSRSLRGETLTGVELVFRPPSGREVHVLENAAPLRDAEERVVGAVLALQDITALRKQERLRDEFIAAVAHELKTPVTTIRGYAELLRRWTPQQREAHERQALDVISTETRRINLRVQEMLEVARFRRAPARLRLGRFDLGELAAVAVARMQALTQIQLSLHREGAVPVEADRERLEEVLVNLLDHAIDSSPEGKSVEVRVWAREQEALASVRDHGAGIPRTRQPHVFDPFYEAVPPGAPGYRSVVSLTLYLSRLAVEAHQGRIWMESEEGAGSTLSFSLPLATGGADVS
ncbi:MAG TPA: PAS domain S-box protein [Myxococcales bacterium]